MTRLRSLVLLGLLLGSFFGVPATVSAQATSPGDDFGLTQVGSATKLSGEDPRVIVVRIINVALSLLGIILVCLILYAGFLWMTSGGDATKIENAQKIIRNAVIGVIIILSSWAITRFILKSLTDATGGGGAGGQSSDMGGRGRTGSLGGSGGIGGFRLEGIEPSGSVPIRNVQVRFLFTQDVTPEQVSANVKVLKAADQTVVAGRFELEGRLATFTPSAACPAPNATRFCFDENTAYIAKVENAMRSGGGQPISCGGLGSVCEERFSTGSLVDAAPPSVILQQPFEGQSLPQNSRVEVVGSASDDSGISLLQFSADGRMIARVVPQDRTSPRSFEGRGSWDTMGVTLGAHRVDVTAFDIDSNRITSQPVSVMVRSELCFNGVQDTDETGIDCGGGCGICSGSGGACRVASECASAVCTEGRCVDRPVITGITPDDAAIGTMVTISGANFGAREGEVLFANGIRARLPSACTEVGTGWTANAVIVEVPVGAQTGPIKLKNIVSGLEDGSNDAFGPLVGVFTVSTTTYPGLCGVTPVEGAIGTNVRLIGSGFGASSQSVFVDSALVTAFRSWANREIGMSIPALTPGSATIRVRVGDQFSNPTPFLVTGSRSTEPPLIEAVEPSQGPIGQYITLRGRNFGNQAGVVKVYGANGLEGNADTDFPDACDLGSRYWSNTSITIKVPATLRGQGLGASASVAAGVYQLALQRQDGSAMSNRANLTVVTGEPGPGLCTLLPDTGPTGTEVRFSGERFGVQTGVVRFTGAATPVPAGSILEWTDQTIRAVVPSGARTGAVSIDVNQQVSNPLPYTVRNCNEDAAICSTTERCCEGSGVCVPQTGGVCPLVSREAHYAWRMSTGEIPLYPEVVEECNPPSRRLSSPSPWSGRPGGTQVCVNADMIVRFTTRLDANTVNGSTFLVKQCTSADDACENGAVIPAAVGFPRMEAADQTSSLIRFRPGSNNGRWAPSAFYQVFLTTNIRSERGLAMPPREACGAGNAYCFRFATRTSNEACAVGSVLVNPGNYEFEDVERTTDVHANPLAADDACLQLNPEGYAWTWSVRDQENRLDGRVNVTQIAGAQGHLPDQTATAQAETGLNDPSRVTASVAAGRATVSGFGEMSVVERPFTIQSYGPNCEAACTNAAVWAITSAPIRAASLTVANVVFRRCTDAECRTMDEPFSLAQSGIRVTAVPGEAAPGALGRMIFIDPGAALRTGQFYRVILRSGPSAPSGGIVSTRGRSFASLNHDQGFSWIFKTKTENTGQCTVDRVALAPDEKIETEVGARQRFVAFPFSAPDTCSETGQMLVGNRSYAWAVTNAAGQPDPSIARLVIRNDGANDELREQTATVRAGVTTGDTHLVEAIALRDPGEGETRLMTKIRATTEGRSGTADYGVLCGQRSENACRAGYGLTTGGCCALRPTILSRYPNIAGTDICRNTDIFADFSTTIDQSGLEGKIFLAERHVAVVCPAGTRSITNVLAGTSSAWYARVWTRFIAFVRPSSAIADVWCVGAVPARVEMGPQGQGTRVSLRIEDALGANKEYRVYVRGETDMTTTTRLGIFSTRGVKMEQERVEWTFRTAARICAADNVQVTDTNADSPYLFTVHPESHLWRANVQALSPTGAAVPIVSVRQYLWSWQPWVSSERTILPINPISGRDGATTNVQTNNKNGQATISARMRIDRDELNVPSSTGRVIEGAQNASARFCERPWPARDLGPFTDAASSRVLAPWAPAVASSNTFYNFSTMYCMDAGVAGEAGDLPGLRLSTAPIGRAEADQGIVRQYLLSFAEPAFRGDGIGIRLANNPTHVSARDWYDARGFRGSPQTATIDGYEAVKDGNTVYISASNMNTAGTSVASVIYILSLSQDAKSETQEIFKRLLEAFTLNVNITTGNSNVCVVPARNGGNGLLIRTRNVEENGVTTRIEETVECSADWECGAIDTNARCASIKEKAQRDRTRLSDVYRMNASLEAAKMEAGIYPALTTGSFVSGVSTSRWPSWSQTLGASLASGATLPRDPVNRFVSCGRCRANSGGALGAICSETSECARAETCVAMTGEDANRNNFDPATCWNPERQRYLCPMLAAAVGRPLTSHIYQYRTIDQGSRYELATTFEGVAASGYTPVLERNTARGGTVIYDGFCANTEYAAASTCVQGASLATGQTCRVGDTRPTACVVNGQPGTKIQICSDCTTFIDGPQTVCTANVLCGNGRVDTGEICDDGIRNGQYGFCSRTCQTPEGSCGDGVIGTGELCDNGSPAGSPAQGTSGVNGAYCGLNCTLAQSCSLDCRERAASCGDRRIDPTEECDGNTQQTAKGLCTYQGNELGNPCDSDNDCPSEGRCAQQGVPEAQPCAPQTTRLCSGGERRNQACANDAACGVDGRCIENTYPTFHVRTCGAAGEFAQCNFSESPWSACRLLASCGNGIVEANSGEQCDDGIAGNIGTGRCTPQCRLNRCGDAFAQQGVEDCDFGGRNGVRPGVVEYGSVGMMCTNECRLSAVTGGYCGNGLIESGESCDGTQIPPDATCQSLGFDYPRGTTLSCTNRCVISGCELCSTRLEASAENTIQARVNDGILQRLPLPNARVQLRYNGTPIAETFTDTTGLFRFEGVHTNTVCGNYTIVIALQGVKFNYATRILARTTDPNDGYFTYTSEAFSKNTFLDRVGRSIPNQTNVILLMPRPGTAETFVIREWTSSPEHPGQNIDPQLLMPIGMGYTYTPGTTSAPAGTYTRCRAATGCTRTINWSRMWTTPETMDQRGSLNIAQAPYAGLACSEASGDGGSSCTSSDAITETILYKRVDPVPGGVYRYFLVDFIPPNVTQQDNPAAFANPERTNSSIDTPELRTKVRVAWRNQDGFEQYREFIPYGITAPNGCLKYWHVFDQDAITGNITEVNRFMCNPWDISQGQNTPHNDHNSLMEGTLRTYINLLLTATGYPIR